MLPQLRMAVLASVLVQEQDVIGCVIIAPISLDPIITLPIKSVPIKEQGV
jgi:hypothetical protein